MKSKPKQEPGPEPEAELQFQWARDAVTSFVLNAETKQLFERKLVDAHRRGYMEGRLDMLQTAMQYIPTVLDSAARTAESLKRRK